MIGNFRNDAKKIAATFGTPTYVVYERLLKENYKRFYDSFEENYNKAMVAYSVKTNYLPAILSILHSKGAGMEVVSGFELYLALKTGVSPSRIIFNGPSKTVEELDFAIKSGILLINADSTSELQKIDKIGNKYGKVIDVGIRINIETITWKKFGIPQEYAEEAYKFASKLKNINVRGLHVHIGTGISNPKPYIWALDHLLKLMRKLRDIGIRIDFLDIGGGFPASGVGRWAARDSLIDALSWRLKKSRLRFSTKFVDVLKSEKPRFPNVPTSETFARSICNKLKEKLNEYGLPTPVLILEPGRAIVNTAVTLLVRVVDIKKFKEKLVMVDGGINLVPSLQYEAHRLINVTGKGTNFETVKLAGPLCTETDILCRRAKVLSVNEGDIIEIFDVGAYSICQSVQFIKPRASVVLVRDNGDIIEVRRRENYEDLISLDVPSDQSNIYWKRIN
jgi:diaminopimelate decarboxylase